MSLDEVLADPEVQELRVGDQETVTDWTFEEANEWDDRDHFGNWVVTRQRESLLIDFWHMFELEEGSFESGDTEHWRLEYAVAVPIRPVRTWERA